MGCDGGTIAKRSELVKTKRKGHQEHDKNADLSAKWQFCSLSGLRLKKPIVACQLGRLYNKDAIIEHLLKIKSSQTSAGASSSTVSNSSTVSHIRSLKDVKELKLKEKPDFDKTHNASSGSEQFKAQFVCPVSGLDINGKYKFFYILTCGCVISERALKEVSDDNSCIICFKPYNSKLDLIVLNGDENEVKELKEKLLLRKRQYRSDRRPQEITATSSTSSTTKAKKKSEYLQDDTISSSKRHKSAVR